MVNIRCNVGDGLHRSWITAAPLCRRTPEREAYHDMEHGLLFT